MHNRKSIRLPGYDYSSPGTYFITLCTQHRVPWLGRIDASGMHYSAVGQLAEDVWRDLPSRFPWVTADAFIAMPDHVHGIIIISESEESMAALTRQHTPRLNAFQRVVAHSISTIVQSFKSQITRIGRHHGYPEFQWQRNYYERILPAGDALERCRWYIRNNPRAWWMKHGGGGG